MKELSKELPENYILTKEEFKIIREFLKRTQEDFGIMLGYRSKGVMISYKETGAKPITKSDTIILLPYYDSAMHWHKKQTNGLVTTNK